MKNLILVRSGNSREAFEKAWMLAAALGEQGLEPGTKDCLIFCSYADPERTTAAVVAKAFAHPDQYGRDTALSTPLKASGVPRDTYVRKRLARFSEAPQETVVVVLNGTNMRTFAAYACIDMSLLRDKTACLKFSVAENGDMRYQGSFAPSELARRNGSQRIVVVNGRTLKNGHLIP